MLRARNFVAIKIEGGIWSDGTFEARMDAIWDGADPPVKGKDAHENNLAAANFIRSQDPSYNAFIITSYSFGGSSSAADRALAAR